MNEENEVKAQEAQLHFTIGITRKATGITETYEMIGTPVAETPDEEKEES